jgi:hypothetical protein
LYAKIFTSIFDGSMRGHSDLLLVFVNILCHADKDGVVDRTCRAIADETGLSLRRVEAAIVSLESPDEQSRSRNEDGRRLERIDPARTWGWKIVNYLHYRDLRSELDRREQNREAQKRHRQHKSADVSKRQHKSAQSAQVEVKVDAEVDVSTGNVTGKRLWNDKIDYEKAKPPEINDYRDIENPANDPILIAIAVTGERGKMGWGHWLKQLNRARKALGREQADRLFRGCLKELYGEMKAGECDKPGAVLNIKLEKTLM